MGHHSIPFTQYLGYGIAVILGLGVVCVWLIYPGQMACLSHDAPLLCRLTQGPRDCRGESLSTQRNIAKSEAI